MLPEEKKLFNPFIAAWMIFGLVAVSYGIINSFINGTYTNFSITTILITGATLLVTILYTVAFIKYRRKPKLQKRG